MIIHGRQQILPPNMIIGRTQIQGACIGLERIVGLWLGWQAVQAIVGAFGQRDGWAVINATNAYLNGIAGQGAAGKAKAQALAGFINEDPMMVCSLGLEVEGVTMPIRYLQGDGNSWIDSGVYATAQTIADLQVWYEGSGTIRFFGSRPSASDSAHAFYIAYDPSWYTEEGSLRTVNGYLDAIKIYLSAGAHDMSLQPNKFVLDGTNYTAHTNSGSTYTLLLMAWRTSASAIAICTNKGGLGRIDLKNTSGGNRLFVPCTNKNGMVDLETATFYPNQGTGTFGEYYLRNGQPWTPSTP